MAKKHLQGHHPAIQQTLMVHLLGDRATLGFGATVSGTNLTSGSFAAVVRTDSTTAAPGKVAKHCARRTAHRLTCSDTNGEGRGKEFSVNLLGIPPFFVQGKHYPVPRKEEGC